MLRTFWDQLRTVVGCVYAVVLLKCKKRLVNHHRARIAKVLQMNLKDVKPYDVEKGVFPF